MTTEPPADHDMRGETRTPPLRRVAAEILASMPVIGPGGSGCRDTGLRGKAM